MYKRIDDKSILHNVFLIVAGITDAFASSMECDLLALQLTI